MYLGHPIGYFPAANIRGITTYSLHPGVIATELGRHLGNTYVGLATWVWNSFMPYFVKTPLQGAQTTIYCAVDERCADETGLYYSDCAVRSAAKAALDVDAGRRLWEESLKLVDLKPDYDPFGANQ